MAQIKIEITYDPSKETLERAVSSLTAKGTPSNAPAFDTECAVKATIAAQRFIAANEVDSYVNYLREIAGMTDDQIAAVCGEYVSANSTLLQAAAAGEVKTEGAGPTPCRYRRDRCLCQDRRSGCEDVCERQARCVPF